MGTFKFLTTTQTKELDELLDVADAILGTATPVIKGNAKAATAVGTAIGGAGDAAISAGVAMLPVGIVALIVAGISWLFGSNKAKKKEQQKQANYCKEFAKKQQKIYEKYEALKKEHERTDKKKDDIIKKHKEKIAEYEAIFEALKKKRSALEGNLSFA